MEDLGDERIVEGDPPAPIEARYRGRARCAGLAASPAIAGDVAGGAASRLPAAALRHGCVPDRGRAPARLVSAARQRAGERRTARGFSFRCGARRWRRRSRRRRPGCCAITIRPICCGSANAGTLPASACSIFRTRCWVPPPTTSPRCCRMRASTCRKLWKWRCSAATSARGRTATAVSTPPNFAQLYATLAAQRATKILGIFARLNRRDGKPQYLRHIPRIWRYLQRSLAHPALAPLQAWYAANVPAS